MNALKLCKIIPKTFFSRMEKKNTYPVMYQTYKFALLRCSEILTHFHFSKCVIIISHHCARTYIYRFLLRNVLPISRVAMLRTHTPSPLLAATTLTRPEPPHPIKRLYDRRKRRKGARYDVDCRKDRVE